MIPDIISPPPSHTIILLYSPPPPSPGIPSLTKSLKRLPCFRENAPSKPEHKKDFILYFYLIKIRSTATTRCQTKAAGLKFHVVNTFSPSKVLGILIKHNHEAF